MELPEIKTKEVNELFNMLNNVVNHYLKKHTNMTNEELHLVFYRLEQYKILQPSIQLMQMFTNDTKKEDSEASAKKSGMYV
ncbi:MAG: hypothetical protein GWN01_05535 [Nitrosopumilaceae archaeon]|nr:hypothetical protein [Nitrosopumilaceae archaeon]NIU86810.1 hypothetical protein [Nitrosopumilaceae archaeon]NIX61007.1 hypothetical protein [Nitrosopumilaceae archaeon]